MYKNVNKGTVLFLILLMTSLTSAASYEYDSLNRLSRVVYSDGSKIVYHYDASGNRSEEIVAVRADLDVSGIVDLEDFAILASQWMLAPGNPSADIAPWPSPDNQVDLLDLLDLAAQWLAGAPY